MIKKKKFGGTRLKEGWQLPSTLRRERLHQNTSSQPKASTEKTLKKKTYNNKNPNLSSQIIQVQSASAQLHRNPKSPSSLRIAAKHESQISHTSKISIKRITRTREFYLLWSQVIVKTLHQNLKTWVSPPPSNHRAKK